MKIVRHSGAASYRRRMVRRARTLQMDQYFLGHLEWRRTGWNEDNPHFRVSGAGCAAERLPAWGGVPIPQTLDTALAGAERHDEASKEPRYAADSWAWLCLFIANTFWPPEDFPHVMGNQDHPAMPFVALCLIYDPAMVDPETVFHDAWLPAGYTWNPSEPEEHPFVAAKLEAHNSVMRALYAAEGSGQGMTAEELRDLRITANSIVMRRFYGRRRADDAPAWFVLPILPGMRSSDVRAAEPHILACASRLTKGEDPVHLRIRSLIASGLSQRAIAARLGVSRGTVTAVVNKMSG